MIDKSQLGRSRRGFLGTSVVLGAGLVMGAPLRSLGATDSGGRSGGRLGALATTPTAGASSARIAGAVALSMSAVVRDGFGDVLPRPFEIDLLASSPHLQVSVFDQVATRLGRLAFDSSDFKPIEYVFLPKRQPAALRRCAVIDPVDLISYLSLSVLAAPSIEACRSARAEKSVFSFRFSGRPPHLFNRNYVYGSFVRHVDQRRDAPATKVLVTADIESFYDRLALDTVRASLLRCSVERWVVDYLVDLLSFWSAGAGRGLPVGSNASRILAEAVLAGIDDELRAAGVDYSRFVDDFRFFAPDVSTAETWLRQLTRSLRVRGLEVNRAKTRLLDPETLTTLSESGMGSRSPLALMQDKRSPSEQKRDVKPPADDKKKSAPKPEDPPNPDSWKDGPRRFRQPRRGEYRRLRDLDLVSLRADVGHGAGGSSASLRDFVAASIYQRDYASVRDLPDLLAAHPDDIAYGMSALVATSESLPDDVRQHVAARFAAMLVEGDPPPHVAMEIVDLLSSDGYRSPAALLAYLGALGRRTGTYLGRAVLDGLARCEATLDRRTVARVYGQLNAWGQRAVLTPTLAGSAVATVPSIVRSARRSAATDPFMSALIDGLGRPPVA